MSRESAAAKARRYLAEARVVVQHVDGTAVRAAVRGDSGVIYNVAHNTRGWSCNCPAKALCSHITAMQLVTLAPSMEAGLAAEPASTGPPRVEPTGAPT